MVVAVFWMCLFIYLFIYLSIYLFIYFFIFRQNSENTYMNYAWWMQQHETLSSIRITSFDSIPIWLLNKKYFEWYYFLYQALSQFTVQKISFPLRISSVNVTKSSGNCGFGHILLKKFFMENFIFCAMIIFKFKKIAWTPWRSTSSSCSFGYILKEYLLSSMSSFMVQRSSMKFSWVEMLCIDFIRRN